jgi:hypothetical protein
MTTSAPSALSAPLAVVTGAGTPPTLRADSGGDPAAWAADHPPSDRATPAPFNC